MRTRLVFTNRGTGRAPCLGGPTSPLRPSWVYGFTSKVPVINLFTTRSSKVSTKHIMFMAVFRIRSESFWKSDPYPDQNEKPDPHQSQKQDPGAEFRRPIFNYYNFLNLRLLSLYRLTSLLHLVHLFSALLVVFILLLITHYKRLIKLIFRLQIALAGG